MYMQENYEGKVEETRLSVYLKNSNHSQLSKHCDTGMRKDRSVERNRDKG